MVCISITGLYIVLYKVFSTVLPNYSYCLPLLGSSLEEKSVYHIIFCFSIYMHQFSSARLLSHVRLFATPWTAARQASLSITNSRSLLKLMFIESMMPSNHVILCRPLLLLTSVFPSIRVFSNESALCIRWPKYWSFSFNISPSNEHRTHLL